VRRVRVVAWACLANNYEGLEVLSDLLQVRCESDAVRAVRGVELNQHRSLPVKHRLLGDVRAYHSNLFRRGGLCKWASTCRLEVVVREL